MEACQQIHNRFRLNMPKCWCKASGRSSLVGVSWFVIWVDIEDARIGLFDPVSRTNSFIHLDSHVGCVVPTDRGNLLAATSDGYKLINFTTGKVTSIGDPEKHRFGNRFNDGKCDPWGRFWAGSMNYALSPKAGSLGG